MTDDSAVTAAELDKELLDLLADCTWTEEGDAAIAIIENAITALAALRRERDEATSITKAAVDQFDNACADIAKKDAALRKIAAHNVTPNTGASVANGMREIARAALAPAAQGETHDTPLLQKIRTTPSMYREVASAPAPSAGETRAAVIKQCVAELDRMLASPENNYARGALQTAARTIRALTAAPTTGEPGA